MSKACGGQIQTTVRNLTPEVLGTCASFEEKQVGDKRYNFFNDGSAHKSVTVVLRGGAEHFIEEAERSLHDALCIVKRARQNTTVVVCSTPTPRPPHSCTHPTHTQKHTHRLAVAPSRWSSASSSATTRV